MEFGRKRNSRPYDSGETSICIKKPNNSESLELKGHASESVASDDEKLPLLRGHNIFRIFVPVEMESHLGCDFPLNALEKYEDIKAQIKLIVGPRENNRVVMVYAKEEHDSTLPPAVDGLLRVHRFFLKWLRDDLFPPIPEGEFETVLLVPAVQVSSLINSSTIKSTEQRCSCKINVSGAGYEFLKDDSMVWVSGKCEDVHVAVELIASYLKIFLVDQSTITTIEKKYYLLVKSPHHGISLYGRVTSLLSRSSSNQSSSNHPAQAIIIQSSHLRVEMSKLYADAIIGIEGANITRIRLTGATFNVDERQKVPDQIVVWIDGSDSQVCNAERLMLMFIAEAGGPQSTDTLYKGRVFVTCHHMHYPQTDAPRLAEQTGGNGSSCGTTT